MRKGGMEGGGKGVREGGKYRWREMLALVSFVFLICGV